MKKGVFVKSQIWSSAAFLALFSFHLYYVAAVSNKFIDPIRSCESVMDQISKDKKLVRLVDPSRENFYRFYNVENIKPGFEKRPDFIVGEATAIAKGNTDYECKITLYN